MNQNGSFNKKMTPTRVNENSSITIDHGLHNTYFRTLENGVMRLTITDLFVQMWSFRSLERILVNLKNQQKH